MASPLTLRLDPKTRQKIARLARRQGVTTSAVIRRAIAAWADREEAVGSPYEAMADLIGVVRGGDPKRSEKTGRRFAALLKRGARQQ
ncbi:MAG TPA: ribbon-helix-helix protein, CopG family [Candidatus Acidoferrum sp.]|nr:ribbon-helix-helix protein, CopG family [Candidatus Acidoferrum sp.]